LQGRLDRSRKRLSAAQVRLMSFDFRAAIGRLHIRLQRVSNDLSARAERFLRRKRDLAERLRLQLEERSPLRVLERGYAIAYDAAGNVLRSADAVALGDSVAVQLHRGRLTAEVKRKD
jgi:exodeoxyribonuclease VII large subunit